LQLSDYAGYISPDKYYYDTDEKGSYGYERGIMSWIGPNQEAFTVSLITRMIDVLFPGSRKNSQQEHKTVEIPGYVW
jgi:hypothetical protein